MQVEMPHVAETHAPSDGKRPRPRSQDLLSLPQVTPTQRSAPGPQPRSPWSTFPSYTVQDILPLLFIEYLYSMSSVLLSILQYLI